MQLKFGLIGCGRVSKKHVDCLKQIPEAKIVAVCDIVEKKAKKLAEKIGCEYYTDYQELLKNPEVDVVEVLTEPSKHAEIVIESAKAKKNIICEKPMTLNIFDANRMVNACKKNGVKFLVVKQNRFNLPVVRIKEALDKGRFGKLLFLNTTVRWHRDQGYYESDEWRNKKGEGCGVIFNQTSHHIDMLYYLGGEVESVYCIKKILIHDIFVEDSAVAILTFKNGALGTYEGSTCAFPRDIEGSVSILGETGSARAGGYAMNKIDFWQFNNFFPEDVEMNSLIVNPPDCYGYGHLDFLKHAIDCIVNKKESIFEGENMIGATRLIIAMMKSAKENRRVFLEEIKDDDRNMYE